MIFPRLLAKGDTVAIIAPASPAPHHLVEQCKTAITLIGFNPVIFPSCYLSNGYLAGEDNARANDINRAFENIKIHGIFCLRSGYGCARLLPLIDFDLIQHNPKVFVGYSDITALHTAFSRLCDLATYHGPNALDIARCLGLIAQSQGNNIPPHDNNSIDSYSVDSYSVACLLSCITSDNSIAEIKNHDGSPLHSLNKGIATGELTGGNLSVLVSTLGSPYEIDCVGKILFIEDINESIYRIDRMLTSLALAGKFSDCSGIILGTFTNCDEDKLDCMSKLTLSSVIESTILPYNKPTISHLLAGHTFPSPTLPFGRKVFLNSNDSKIMLI